MKKTTLFYLVLTVLTLSSCNDVYRNFQSVKELKWYDTDVKTFNVNIPEDGYYDLIFAMRHSTGYPFTSIKVNIEQKTPEGKLFEKNAEFPVTDKNGNYIGDVTGELWDIESSFDENVFLKKGNYTFKIKHNMNNNPVILVIDIGLIVRRHEN